MSSIFFNKINQYLIINILFSFLVISFIAGNLVLNLNILFLIIFSIIFFKKKIISFKFELVDKVVLILFLYIPINGFFNNLNLYLDGSTKDFTIFIKSLLYLRFLILYLVINFLVGQRIINFKYFFFTAFGAIIFVSLDIIYQYFFGYDIFGFKGEERRLSGPFGDELVAGAFIQRFSLFALFLIPFFLEFKKTYLKYLFSFLLICLILISLIFAGNRVPLLFFILSVLAILIFEKQIRKFIAPFFILVCIFIYASTQINENIYKHLIGFQKRSVEIFSILSPDNILTKEEEENQYKNSMFYTFEYKGTKYKMTNTYLKEFKTGYVTWKDNFFFGGGVNSFKVVCPKAKVLNCGNHPHNYYLEILAELGLFGFFIILILFLLIFYETFIKRYFFNSRSDEHNLVIPFLFLFFAEIFPIKTTGSFFSSSSATYVFLLLSLLISVSRLKKLD